jgi:formylglycine-generating enzyme required for sulfatase activity
MQLMKIFSLSIFLFTMTGTQSADFTNYLGIEFKIIEHGRFFMGSCPRLSQTSACPAAEGIDLQATHDEFPQHQVTIAKPFEISVYEITLEQFQSFLEQKRPDLLTADFNNYNEPKKPVILVSWDDVQVYLKWLNETKPIYDTGVYRLPTESEWEYAARGGTQTVYWWGNEMREGKANCNGCDNQWGPHQPLPVGTFPANPFGLYDMVGNVSEWVQDCWNHNYVSAPTKGSAWSTGNCLAHVIRGGSWSDTPGGLVRIAARDKQFKDYRSFNIGFRLIREVDYDKVPLQYR